MMDNIFLGKMACVEALKRALDGLDNYIKYELMSMVKVDDDDEGHYHYDNVPPTEENSSDEAIIKYNAVMKLREKFIEWGLKQ